MGSSGGSSGGGGGGGTTTTYLPTPPSGAAYSTQDRMALTNSALGLSSEQLYLLAITLPSGLTVSNISFMSITPVMVGGTHGWFALFDQNRVMLAVTADQTAAVWWPASAIATLPIATTAAGAASSFVTTYGGVHYLGICVTAGTMPTVLTRNSINPTALAFNPPLAGTSNNLRTTPPTFPFTAAAIAADNTTVMYGWVS